MRRLQLLSAVPFLLLINGYACVEIIGGNEAAPHSRPYMVFLKDGDRSCGGTLIKANWVLTAAHCNFGNASKAVLGAHSLKVNTNQQQIKVKRAIKHPCFDWETKVNDLQLLQLERPAKLNKFVSILQPPNQEEYVKQKTQCSTAGWGITDMKDKIPSDVLREVNLIIVDNKTCNKAYSKAKPKETITNNMICAGPLKNRKDDTCQGDSGGPLICNKKFTGIVSFGPKNECGNPKYPGVYTRLTNKYLAWIRDTTGGATL